MEQGNDTDLRRKMSAAAADRARRARNGNTLLLLYADFATRAAMGDALLRALAEQAILSTAPQLLPLDNQAFLESRIFIRKGLTELFKLNLDARNEGDNEPAMAYTAFELRWWLGNLNPGEKGIVETGEFFWSGINDSFW
jgi:hypothetical protein